MKTPQNVQLNWPHTFRIIPSHFPPINFFEKLIDPNLMEELFYIESLTNDRLRNEIGDITLVPKEDCISGEGASVVMAAFTHISSDRISRFTDGTYGIYYASKSLNTAIRETVYHRERFLAYTSEPECELTMRVYKSQKIIKPLKDIRSIDYQSLHHLEDYAASQAFGKTMKAVQAWGIVYPSSRDKAGECVAILRPPAISLPVIQTKHLKYVWNGNKIDAIYEINALALDLM